MPVAIELGKRVNLGWLECADLAGVNCAGELPNGMRVLYATQGKRGIWVTVIERDSLRVVAECPLTQRRRRGVVSYHPDYTRVDSRYRGQNIALMLYRFLIGLGITLCAGDSQSAGSRRLWARLCASRGIAVWSRRGLTWSECSAESDDPQLDSDDWDPYELNCELYAHAA